MKKFYVRVSIFTFLFCILIIVIDYLSMEDPFYRQLAILTNSESFITGNVGPDEIKPYIYKVQEDDNTTKLIIGDSVCHQLFNGLQEYNSDITIVGSNAGIAMTGQYILAEEYIKHHPNATDIYLIVLPSSLQINFGTTWGYQYTIMPFVETQTIQLLDEDTIQCMESVYGKFFMEPLVVYFIDRSAINRKIYLNTLKKLSNGYEPENRYEIAEQYIGKIQELCKEHQIRLHLYACPMAEKRKESVEEIRGTFKETMLYDMFPDYLANIYYYPDKQFRDGTHFGGEYDEQSYFNEIIMEMFSDRELAAILKFE